jgi:membrane protein implicated in regulation of membrane protease activity
MNRILYIVLLVFIIIWLIGFFFYSLGAAVHILLLIAILAIILRIYMRRAFSKHDRFGKDLSQRKEI